jgi:Na+-driven multidrug efflux pump
MFITFVAFSTMGFVDLLYLGRLQDSQYLAAASISNAYSIALVFIPVGMISAQYVYNSFQILIKPQRYVHFASIWS